MISPAVIMGLRDRPVENVHLHFGMMSIYQHTPAAMENATATAQGNTHSQIHTHCSMIHTCKISFFVTAFIRVFGCLCFKYYISI